MTDPRKSAIVNELTLARSRNLELLAKVPTDKVNRVLHPDFRPLRWHIGHVGMFESWWILEQIMGGQPPDKELAYVYSTDYPREKLDELPPVETAISFSTEVRKQVLEILERIDLDSEHDLTRDGYIFNNVITHEYQHTETIIYLMMMADLEIGPQRPTNSTPQPAPPREILIPGGSYSMGRLLDDPLFSYDNEWPRHEVALDPFYLDENPATNGEFLAFVNEDGYSNESLWSADGWAWRTALSAEHPLHWHLADDGTWVQKTITGSVALPLAHPIMLISFFEAEAYANYRGKRLPTEREWEVAASWSPTENRQLTYPWGEGSPTAKSAHHGQPLGWSEPVDVLRNISPLGINNMAGNIWEWTSTPFDGYPGFEAFPYAGYSEIWFDGLHRVARGGCFATGAPMLRSTFRNWFYPRTRERFIGVRLAKDA